MAGLGEIGGILTLDISQFQQATERARASTERMQQSFRVLHGDFVKEGEEKFRRRVKRIWIPRWIVRKAMEENIAWIRVKMIEVMELLRRGGRI